MKDKKGSNVGVAAVVIVLIMLLALVVPWTLSLVDTTPGTGTSTQFKGVMENAQHAYIAERIEFHVGVEVFSFYANLQWGNDDGTCTIQATIRNSNGVYDAPLVEFITVPYAGPDRGEFGRINHFGTTLSGVYEYIAPGDYWFVLHVACTEANQFLYWRWYHTDFGADFDPAVVSPNGPCVDNDFDWLWEDDECSSDDSSYLLEGRVYEPGGDPMPPINETTGETIVTPLIDTTEDKDDYDWIMYAILGGVIIIVLVVIVVAVKF